MSNPPAPEELVARAAQAYQDAVGTDLAGFDRLWTTWVLKTYPKK